MSKRTAEVLDPEAEAEQELAAAIAAAAAAPSDEKLPGLGVGVAPLHWRVEGTPAPQYTVGLQKGERPLMFAYLSIQGLGEVPRLLLAEAGASYDHLAITMGETQEVSLRWRERSPNGLMPMLSGMGIPRNEPMSQSGAIIRFLARRFGFCGSSDREGARADTLFETAKDLGGQKKSILDGTGDAASAKSYHALVKRIARMLESMPSPSEAEAALNFGQLQLLNVLLQLEETKTGCVAALSPELEAFRAAASARSRIAAYLRSPRRFPMTCNEKPLEEGGYQYASPALTRGALTGRAQ